MIDLQTIHRGYEGTTHWESLEPAVALLERFLAGGGRDLPSTYPEVQDMDDQLVVVLRWTYGDHSLVFWATPDQQFGAIEGDRYLSFTTVSQALGFIQDWLFVNQSK